MLQATSASYSLLRGFLNALAADDAECAKRFLCEGAEEAAAAGPLGQVVATVGRWVLEQLLLARWGRWCSCYTCPTTPTSDLCSYILLYIINNVLLHMQAVPGSYR